TNRPDSSKDYYTLECILYLLRNVRHNHAQYVRTAAAAGVPVVRLPDRRDLLNYLTGKSATSDKIDRSAPLDMSAQRPVAAAAAAGASSMEPSVPSAAAAVSTDASAALSTVDLDAVRSADAADVSSSAVSADHSDSHSLAKRARIDLDSSGANDATNSSSGIVAQSSTAAATDASGLQAGSAAPAQTAVSEADQLAAVQRSMKERERLAAKLVDETGAARPAVLPERFEGSTLSQVMTIEKIHALRAKRRVKIRDSIKPDESGGALAGADSGAIGGSFFSEDLSLLRDLVSRERLHRDRNSCLQAATRNFADSVLNGVLRAVRAREEGANAIANSSAVTASGGHHHQHSRQSVGSNPAHQQRPTQHLAYSRYDQEKFANRDEAADFFKIDTVGGWGIDMLGRGPAGPGGDASAARGGPGGVARPSDPRRMQQQRQSFGSGTPRTPVPASPLVGNLSTNSTPSSQQKRTSRTPIIIIPATASLISMLNAKDILLEKRFVSIEDKRAAGARRENEALIQRMRPDGTTTVPFRVVDQPQKLTADEWSRVVAVFVQGPAWQFKNWPIGGGNPVDIFARVKAFHLKFADMPTDANVLQWNVI
uniref:CDC73_C domain-containing protein n=1 Tax=Macrostomum lignano TaxID=282301 RepID=A0A1I8I0F9_9PLAT